MKIQIIILSNDRTFSIVEKRFLIKTFFIYKTAKERKNRKKLHKIKEKQKQKKLNYEYEI